MIRYYSIITVILFILGLVSCTKPDDFSEDGAFEFNGAVYNSLQEAVDASLALQDADGKYITLLHDAYGKGADAVAGAGKMLHIDFGDFRYTLADGCSICTGATDAYLKGNGGELSGAGIVLSSDSGCLFLEGNLDINGDLRTSSYTCFTEGFHGTFSGNMSLDDEELYILTDKGRFSIPVFNVTGAGAFMQIGISSALEEKIRIDRLISSTLHPVMADCEGAVEIVSGGQPHIHKYSVRNIPASCTSGAIVEKVCDECGFVFIEHAGEELGKCPAESLVYVPGVEATAVKNGVVAHWECPFCGRCYTDKEGLHELEGPATILALNFEKQPSLYSANLGNPVVVWGFILSVAGIVETLGFSVESIVSRGDDEKWNEVNSALASIQASLSVIEGKIDQLLRKIDIVPYKNLIISRNEKLNFLTAKSLVIFDLMMEYINDGTMDEDMKAEKLSALLSDWSRNVFEGTQIADLNQNMMQQYVSTGIEANVPQMFEAVANCSYLWEHDGYGFRAEAMARDFMLNAISHMMGCCYISSVKEYSDENLRKKELDFYKECFKKYKDAVKAEIDRIEYRQKTYRVYNPDNITFSIYAKHVDFRSWFKNHPERGFPRLNQNGMAVKSCNLVLDDLGLNGRMGMDHNLAKTLYSYYNKSNPTPTSIYRILRDSVGFVNMPGAFDPAIFFVNKNDGFKNIDDDSAYPTYKIFHWEVYRSHCNQDQFGIWSCLNDKCVMENHNFLYYCDISSYEDGLIDNLGEATRWQWWTLVTAGD